MLEKTFSRYAKPLHRYLLRRSCTSALAADLVQETFVRMAQQSNLERIQHSPSYIFRIARNLLIDHKRHHGVSRTDSQPIEYFDTFIDESVGPEAQALGSIELERLDAVLSRLPQRTRDVFVLCRLEGMTHKETARYLRISPSSVQNHMSLALTRIARELGRDDHE